MTTSPGSDRALAVIVFALLAAASLLPVLLTPIPAMVDYPNHLARMYILSRNGTPDANPYYEVAWALYPNLAMDLLIPQIARLISVEDATRLFLLVSQMLIVGGALALERVVKGRIHLAGFAALMVLYCLPFSWGFVNFEFGLSVALFGVAVYLKLAQRAWPLRFVVHAVFVAALFTAHFFALGVYGATLGFYELWRASDRKALYGQVAWRLVLLAIPAVVLAWRSCGSTAARDLGGEGTTCVFLSLGPIWPFRIMNGYNLSVSAREPRWCADGLLVYRGAARLPQARKPDGTGLGIGFATAFPCDSLKPAPGRRSPILRVIPAASPDPSGVLLAVAAQPAMDHGGARRCQRHHARQSHRRLCGLAALSRGLCG